MLWPCNLTPDFEWSVTSFKSFIGCLKTYIVNFLRFRSCTNRHSKWWARSSIIDLDMYFGVEGGSSDEWRVSWHDVCEERVTGATHLPQVRHSVYQIWHWELRISNHVILVAYEHQSKASRFAVWGTAFISLTRNMISLLTIAYLALICKQFKE